MEGAEPEMLTCQKLTTLGSDYLDGALDAAARAELEEHLAACPGCTVWLQQLRMTSRAIGALPRPGLPLEVRQASLAAFDRWAERSGAAAGARSGAAWTLAVPALGTAAVFALLLFLARRPSSSRLDWGTGLALLAAAALLPFLGRARGSRAAIAGVAATLATALIGGGAGPLDLGEGLECLAIVGLSAAAVAGVSRLALRRVAEASALSTGTWAIAGAVAGAAALQVACGAHGSLLHLVAFHVGGVAAVAALAVRFRGAPASAA